MSYHRPETLDDAVALLAQPQARALAGGTDLYPATERQILSGHVVDLAALSSLKGIEETDDGLRIGACTTWSQIASADMPPGCEALQAAAREVGSVQIQNAGTIGGNLCNASPAADGVPPLLILDAEVELFGRGGIRRIGLGDFLVGNRVTAMEPGELVCAVHLPRGALAGSSSFEKLGARRHLVISIAMAAARIDVDKGRVRRAALSIGACSAVAKRLPSLEAALIGARLEDLEALFTPKHIEALSPIDDVRANAEYRRDAALVLCRRAALQAVSAAGERP